MPVLTSVEEKKKQEQKEERKQTLRIFAHDLKTSFLIWIKIGGIISGAMIVLYLFARFALKWDLFYETSVNYMTLFLGIFIFFSCSVVACWLLAFFLYNTKHRRGTKYKEYSASAHQDTIEPEQIDSEEQKEPKQS